MLVITSEIPATSGNRPGVVGHPYRARIDFGRAILDFDQAIAINPAYGQAYYDRGLSYASKGDSDRAIADFGQVIRLSPQYSEAYLNRCWVRAVAGQTQKALADCNQVLQLEPGAEAGAHQLLAGAGAQHRLDALAREAQSV